MELSAALASLGLQQYYGCFVDEELTDLAVLRDLAARPDALRSVLKEIGVSKIGHREKLVNALAAAAAEAAAVLPCFAAWRALAAASMSK